MSNTTLTTMSWLKSPGGNYPLDFKDFSIRNAYTAGGLLEYVGYARPGTSNGSSRWQIIKFSYDGSDRLTGNSFPQNSAGNPSNKFEFEWDERANYTYS
jgi:hypothetical protein